MKIKFCNNKAIIFINLFFIIYKLGDFIFMGIVNTLKLISKKVISEEDLLKRVSLPKNYDIKKGLLFEHSTFGVDGSSYKKEIFSIKNEFGEL